MKTALMEENGGDVVPRQNCRHFGGAQKMNTRQVSERVLAICQRRKEWLVSWTGTRD